MKTTRAEKLEKLRSKASSGSDADRLDAISTAANKDIGRPTRDFCRDQLKDIEQRNAGNPEIALRIAEILERFAHNKGVRERRLERHARVKGEVISESITEPETIETELAPAQQQLESDDTFAVEYPPKHLLWPPDPSVYVPGWIDTTLVTQRLIAGGARGLSPAPSRPDVCEQVIKIALGPTFAFAEITFDMLQRLWFALQGLEPRAEDPAMAGLRHRFWVWQRLFSAVFYLATAKYGYGSLKDPPPDLAFVRELIEQAPLSVYVRQEQLPRCKEAVKQYIYLPGFADVLKEIEMYEENRQ